MLPALLAAAVLAAAPAPSNVLFTLPAGLDEVSGMAYGASGTLFVHEDSGSQPVVVALTGTGAVRARYDLGVQARDWEDMAAGPAGTLLVADIGDNRGTREQGVLLHRIPEPTGPGGRSATPQSIRLTYEDGPHDAEALLVHPRTGQTLVVTKSLLGSWVYSAPQPLVAGSLVRGRRVALERTGTPGGPAIGAVAQTLVTGGAVSPDGRRLVLRTYTDAYVYAVPGDDLAAAFAGEPEVFALPPATQGEAVTWTPDGTALVVTGEGVRVDVQRVEIPAAGQAIAEASPAARADPDGPDRPSHSIWVGGATVVAVTVVTTTWLIRRRTRR